MIMENKILLLFFILIEAAILAFCETDSFNSFASRFNEKTDAGNLDTSKRKDFYLFNSNALVPESKNVAKRPTAFNERYSQPADLGSSLEIRQDISKTNFSEKQSQISEFHQDGYNNWQKEKINPFHPNRQESIQDTPVGQTDRRIPSIPKQPNNEWNRGGNFFQNSQSRWNEEENFKQYQTATNGDNLRTAAVPNMFKPVINSDIRTTNGYGNSFVNNREMNYPLKSEENEKASLTLFNDEEVKSINNYDHDLFQNRFRNQLNSKVNYYNRNADGFRTANYHNPEKGVIINFNTECSTTKPYTNPVFHKFIFTTKPQNTPVEVPTYHIPETTLYTRQMSTPIYYL